jgi:hypothetical protein
MSGWTIFNNDKPFGELTPLQIDAFEAHRGKWILQKYFDQWVEIEPDWDANSVYRAARANKSVTPLVSKPRGDMPAGDMTIREAYAMHVLVAEYGMSAEDVDVHNVVAAVDRMLVALEQNND